MAESSKIYLNELIETEKLIADLNNVLGVLVEIKKQSISTAKEMNKSLNNTARKVEIEELDSINEALATSRDNRKKIIEATKLQEDTQKRLNEAQEKEKTLYEKVKEDLKDITKARNELAIKQAINGGLTKEEGDELNRLQSEYTKYNKALKDAGKTEDQLAKERKKANDELKKQNSTYAQTQKKLTELRDIQKELSIRQKLNNDLTKAESVQLRNVTKEVERLNDALVKTDAEGGVFFRSVGNYQKALEGFKRTNVGQIAVGVGAAITATGLLDKVTTSVFAGTAEKAKNFQILLERSVNVINNVGVAIKDLIIGYIAPSIDNLILKFEKGAAFFTGAFDKIDEINKKIDENNKLISDFKNPFDGLIDRIGETDDITKQLIETRYELIRQETILSSQIQDKIGLEQELQQLKEDDTRSFQARQKSEEQLYRVQASRFAQEKELATKQLDQQAEIVRLGLIREKVGENLTIQQIKSLEFLKDENVFNKVSLEDLEKLKSARANYNALVIENNIFVAENAEKSRKRLRDALENNLDYLKDDFDAQKTFNEALINDQQILFDKRVALLNETRKLSDKSFSDQNKALETFYGKQINLTELLAETDSKRLQEKVRSLELDEKGEQLVLQSLRERRIVLKDFYDAEKTLDQESRDRGIAIMTEQNAIRQSDYDFAIQQTKRRYAQEEVIQENALIYRSKKLKDYAKQEQFDKQKALLEDYDFQKTQIENTIVEENERNIKILALRKKLENDLQVLSQTTDDQLKELNRKEFISKVELFEKIEGRAVDIVRDSLDKQYALRQEARDFELKKTEEQLGIQRDLFINGSENLYAWQKEQRDKIQLEQREADKKQVKQQEAIAKSQAVIETYTALIKKPGYNPQKAFAEAVASTVVLDSLIKNIVQGAFYEGTEHVATSLGKPHLNTSKDQYIIRVDGNERIMKGSDNIRLGGRTNDEVATIVENYNLGRLKTTDTIKVIEKGGNDVKELVNYLKTVDFNQITVDDLGRIIEKKIRYNYTRKTTHEDYRRAR